MRQACMHAKYIQWSRHKCNVACSLKRSWLTSSQTTRMEARCIPDGLTVAEQWYASATWRLQVSSEGLKQHSRMSSPVQLGHGLKTTTKVSLIRCSVPERCHLGPPYETTELMQVSSPAALYLMIRRIRGTANTVRAQADTSIPRMLNHACIQCVVNVRASCANAWTTKPRVHRQTKLPTREGHSTSDTHNLFSKLHDAPPRNWILWPHVCPGYRGSLRDLCAFKHAVC